MLIARVIADPATLETRLDAASASLDAIGVRLAAATMLESGSDVLQIMLPDGDPLSVANVLQTHFAPCDLLVSTREIEIPHLYVSDMDSTIIGQECIDELADYAGLKDRVAAITERAMQGELDFESALRERVGLLEGLGEDAIDACLADRIRPTPGARRLVATLRARGCQTVLVTGGFHHFADRVAENLGFDRVIANRLAVADGRLTGTLVGAITDSSTKERVLREELTKLGEDAIAMATGDGANDIAMIQAADYGIAYHAKPMAAAASNGRIGRGDLTTVLSLLGIPESDWVGG